MYFKVKSKYSPAVVVVFIQVLWLQALTHNYAIPEEEEVVFPRIVSMKRGKRQPTGENRILVLIEARNLTFRLDLLPNSRLFKNDSIFSEHAPDPCHFLGRVISDDGGRVALSTCKGSGKMHGLIFTRKKTFILQPISKLNHHHRFFLREAGIFPHVLLREERKPEKFCGMKHQDLSKSQELHLILEKGGKSSGLTKRVQRSEDDYYTIEIAVFVDTPMMERWFGYSVGGHERDVEYKVLTLMNQVQLVFTDPSMEKNIDIDVVKVEILDRFLGNPDKHKRASYFAFKRDFYDWHYRNPVKDWDHTLLLTGVDIFKEGPNGAINERQSVVGSTAKYGGMCSGYWSFSFIWGYSRPELIAHELAHSLGSYHDGYLNSCEKDKYIMGSNGGYRKQWSKCSNVYIRDFLRSDKSSCLKVKGIPQAVSEYAAP